MKSTLFIVCLTLISITAYCQNYCNDVEKIKGPHGIVIYHSKYFPRESISVWKINTRFYITFRTNGKQGLSEKGLYLNLSDGSKIALPDAKIEARPSHTKEGFTYGTSLPITDKNVGKLTSAYIVKFALGDLKKDVNKVWAIRYMNYVQCIKNKAG